MCGKRQAVCRGHQGSFSKDRQCTPGYLGGLVQGVAAEEAEVLDIVHGGQALGHDALLAPLGQHLALLRHVLPNLLRDARPGLHGTLHLHHWTLLC